MRAAILCVLARLATAAALAAHATAFAQSWPTRPISLVVPFAAGGPSDVLARRYAQRLAASLGQPVTVENIAGAGGTLGTARVARANPDGHTLAFGTIGTHAANLALYRNPGYEPLRDFEPVALLGSAPLVLIVRSTLAPNNFREFVDHARANREKLSYGSAGAGSISHMGCLLLMAELGTDITHVPYKGVAPAMNDLMGGQVDFMCDQTTTVVPQLKSGRIRALAMLSRAPSAALPGLAPAATLGFPALDVTAWNGLFAPRDTPRAILDRLNAAVAEAQADPAFRKPLEELGIGVPAGIDGGPAVLRALVSSGMERLVPLLKSRQQYLD